MKLTKEIFEKALNKIGWSLRNVGCEHDALINNKGERTEFILIFGNKIEIEFKRKKKKESYISNAIMCFYFKDCRFEFIRIGKTDPTLCLYAKKTKSVFILFFKYD